MKTKRAGQPSFGSRLARMSSTHRVLIALTTMLVAALLLLANRAQPRQYSGKQRSGDSHNFPRKQLASGNAMKFLDSQHNLRHSNLSEIPIEDSNKIFKGRPSLGSSDAGQDGLDQNKNVQGFLANVNPADLQASSAIKNTLPAADTNPLGFYFNSAAVAKTSGGDGLALEKPVGQNKAALGYYFNKEKPQSVDVQQAGKGSIRQSPEGKLTEVGIEGKPARQGKGLSSILQTSVYLHQDDHSASHQGKAVVATMHNVQQQGAVGGSSSQQGLVGNLTKVDFKPLTISLNTDDV